MRYVDAGYVVCLGALFLYAVSLVLRHRRLVRAAALAESAGGLGPGPGDPAGDGTVGLGAVATTAATTAGGAAAVTGTTTTTAAGDGPVVGPAGGAR